MKTKFVYAFFLGIIFSFSVLAENNHRRSKFSDYSVSIYVGRTIIPSFYVKTGDTWRDDMGKGVDPPIINFAGRYHVGLHSCGAECRYYTLSDLSNGRGSKALVMFSSDGEKPTRTKDGRPYVTDLLTRPGSAMIIAQYHIEASAEHSAECRERAFIYSRSHDVIKPITPTIKGCERH